MLLVSIVIGLSIIFVSLRKVRAILKLAHIPGPIVPTGIKGNIPEFVATPRITGPSFVKRYGPVYRNTEPFQQSLINFDTAISK